MSISFFPLGIPFSSSLSTTATFTLSTQAGSLPTTAALAQFISGSIGPVGPDYETVALLRLI